MRDDLSPDREEERVARRLPLNEAGVVRGVEHGAVVVEFAGVERIVLREDLRVLTTAEEIPERRREKKERDALNELAGEHHFYTPETTDKAFKFGRETAFRGEPQLKRHEFLSTALDHPYPSSLWRAYLHGRQRGKQQRRRHLEGSNHDNDV